MNTDQDSTASVPGSSTRDYAHDSMAPFRPLIADTEAPSQARRRDQQQGAGVGRPLQVGFALCAAFLALTGVAVGYVLYS